MAVPTVLADRLYAVPKAILLAGIVCCGVLPRADTAEEPPEITHDGLHLVRDSVLGVAWAKPDADFSVFDKIIILDLYVAFERRWERDQRGRLSGSDRQRIKDAVVREFNAVFKEELETNGGYAIVEEAGLDVMILRPAVIDLVVNATDQRTAGRSSTWVVSSGSATLFAEIYDSVSGEILARAVDAQAGPRRRGSLGFRGSSVTNIADARAIFRMWATALRDRLDEIHGRFLVEESEGP